ncbi:MAG: hypothetical protein KatS3mg090_0535 [Patescibacteria group bacterium]|nr:MAG: hypothetical protein KatS3mg090_0535 [Patescibacteria group bacterium]
MEDLIRHLKKTVLILTYSLFILTPLIFYKNTSEIFEFNKLVLIYLLTSFIFGIFLIFSPKNLIIKENIFYAVFFYTIIQLIALFFSIDKWTSFFGYYGRFNGGVLSTIYFFLLFTSLSQILSKNNVLKILQFSVITSVLVSIIGILSKYNFDLICLALSETIANTCWTENFKPAERIFSTLGQPNWLANYLGVNLLFATFLILKNKSKLGIFGYFLVFTINLIALIFTRSLTGQFAIILSAIAFIIISYFNRRVNKTKLNYLLILTILVSAIFTDKYFITHRLNNLKQLNTEPAQTQTELQQPQTETAVSNQITDSGKIRLIVWKGAWEIFKRYPIFGTGPETFGISYFFTRPTEHNLISEWNYIYNKAHNEFLNYLATEGIIGFIAYLGLVILPMIISFNKYLKTKHLMYLLILMSFLNININNLTGFSTSTISLYIFFLNAVLLIYENDKTKNYFISNLKTSLAVAFMFISVYLIQVIYRADLLYEQGVQAKKQSDYITAQNRLSQAEKLLSHPNYQTELSSAKAQLYLLVKQLNPEEIKPAIEIYDIDKNNIIEINEKAIKKSPYNIVYRRNAGRNSFFLYQADLDKNDLLYGINQLKKAHEIAPTEINGYYMYNFLLFLYYQDNKAKLNEIKKTSMKELIDLKPDYIPSHLLYSKYILLTESKNSAINYLKDVNKKLNNFDITNEIKSLESL